VCFYTTTGKIVTDVKSAKSKKMLAVLTFDTKDDKEVLAKVGISHVGYEGAKNNLDSEIKDWDFDATREAARETVGQRTVNQIQVNATEQIMTKQSSTHRCTIHQSVRIHSVMLTAATGEWISKFIRPNGKTIYTVFSLWDTFRGNHPLKTILDPERDNEFIETLY
jgi:putative alpha-1,2-mannosidase